MKVDYIALSIPIYFILIGVELAYSFYKGLKLYRLNDSITNISLGIGQQITGIFAKSILFLGYLWLYNNHRLFTIENTPLNIFLLFLGADFFYYWFHRLSHEVNAMWAAHIVHHQSEDYNLSVALRQSWLQSFFSWVFYLPLAWFGFDPIQFLALSSFITLYQFWIHTQTIKSLGPLEYIFNTPSHHRVHHGSNKKYIDKNHAGTLIIWDRLFGTFQKEEETVIYGITKGLNSWNPVWANLHYWVDIYEASKKKQTIFGKLKLLFTGPDSLYTESIIPSNTKYNVAANRSIHIYAFVQFTIILAIASALLFNTNKIPYSLLIAISLVLIIGICNIGALFERKKWFVFFEYLRLYVWLFFLPLLEVELFSMTYVILITILILNTIWLNQIIKTSRNEFI